MQPGTSNVVAVLPFSRYANNQQGHFVLVDLKNRPTQSTDFAKVPFRTAVAEVRSLDIVLPTDAGKELRLRTVSRPEKHLAILLDKL